MRLILIPINIFPHNWKITLSHSPFLVYFTYLTMSDDDRDIDVESDVSYNVPFIEHDLLNFWKFQEGEDSDSRQPNIQRQSSGNQYYSQVSYFPFKDNRGVEL